MGDIVNLRRARKAAKRAEASNIAAAQRVKHGTPKMMRQELEMRRKKARGDLEAHRIEREE
jgi:hypothetical protein